MATKTGGICVPLISDFAALAALVPPNSRFWLLTQNNSGGYYCQDEEVGLGPAIIVVARSKREAMDIVCATAIGGQNYTGSTLYRLPSCECCGPRWNYWADDGSSLNELQERYEDYAPEFLLGGSFVTVNPFVWFSDGRRFELTA